MDYYWISRPASLLNILKTKPALILGGRGKDCPIGLREHGQTEMEFIDYWITPESQLI